MLACVVVVAGYMERLPNGDVFRPRSSKCEPVLCKKISPAFSLQGADWLSESCTFP